MAYNTKSLENLNRGRPKKPKTILRAQIIELQEEFDSIAGNRFIEVINSLLTMALESPDEDIRLKASIYVTNRLLGMPTQHTENTTDIVINEDIEAAKALLLPQVKDA